MSARSPFPGMDPWLEGFWDGLHTRLVTLICDQLQPQLGDGLIACIEERVYIVSPSNERSQFLPDVHVYEGTGGRLHEAKPASSSAIMEPRLVQLRSLQLREPYIEIRDFRSNERVITTVELVSAENKRGREGRQQYRRKQRAAMAASVNLVEIDLLRGGRPITLAAQSEGSRHYHASVVRSGRDDVAEYYEFPLQSALGAIKVPLAPRGEDIRLDLQAALDEAYKKGRYGQRIDYNRPPRQPLSMADAEWATTQIEEWSATGH